MDEEVVSFSLEINTEPTKRQLREALALTSRWLSILDQLALPASTKGQIDTLQRVIRYINRVRLVYSLLMAETPFGLIMAAMTLGEMVPQVMGDVYTATQGHAR